MALDKNKVKQIVEPFEREVYETLLKLDKKVESFNVEVFCHKEHCFENQAKIYPDFLVHFKNNGKEYVIVIECKHHRDTSGAIMKDLEGFVYKFKKIQEYYKGDEFIVKPLFLISIDSKEDIPIAVEKEALGNNIHCYSDLLITQFSEAIDALSPEIAFLEFLHSYCKIDISFEPTTLSFRCLRNKNFFDKPSYTFLMPVNDLIRISYVDRANINKQDLFKAYQRAIKEKRLEEIAKFIRGKRNSGIEIFPNNVIVNADKLEFISDENASDSGTIELKNKYGTLGIIDGQHRTYSFCKIKESDIRNNYQFVVTAYQEITKSEQAEMFYTINHEQEGINSDLIMFILAQLLETTKGYAAKILLDIDKEDMFTKPIKKGFEEKEKGAWLKLSTLVNTLTEEDLINYEKPNGGLLQKSKEDPDTPLSILKTYLTYIKKHFKSSWEDGKKGFAQSNQGLAILFIILKRIIKDKDYPTKDCLDNISESTFAHYLDSIDSRILNTEKLVDRALRDVRSKTDRKEVADALWKKIC